MNSDELSVEPSDLDEGGETRGGSIRKCTSQMGKESEKNSKKGKQHYETRK